MKKILAIFTIVLFACSTVFAVEFSGSLTTGLGAQYDQNKDDWQLWLYGDDGEGTHESTITFGFADENGLWSANIVGIGTGTTLKTIEDDPSTEDVDETITDDSLFTEFDAAGSLSADLNLSISKLIDLVAGTTLPVDIDFFTIVYDRATSLRAYNNIAGNNFDRVRSDDNLWHFGLEFAYDDLITVQGTWAPGEWQNGLTGDLIFNVPTSQVLVSALIQPLSGLKVSVDYGYQTEDRSNSNISNVVEDSVDNENTIGVAFDLDLGSMLVMSTNFGISASERYQIEDEYNIVAAVLYGGIDEASAYVEYANHNKPEDSSNALQLGVSGTLGAFSYNAYFGANDVVEFADTYYLGAEAYYTISSVTLGLGVEYAEYTSYNYSGNGFWIVPSVSVSF